MRRKIVRVAALAVLSWAIGAGAASPGHCQFGCYPGTCYNDLVCGSSCYCQKQGLNPGGVCVTRPTN